MPWVCSKCKKENEVTTVYCDECGTEYMGTDSMIPEIKNDTVSDNNAEPEIKEVTAANMDKRKIVLIGSGIAVFLIAVITVGCFAYNKVTHAWREITSNNGVFSIQFPGGPKFGSKSDNGVTSYAYILDQEPDAYYAATYSDVQFLVDMQKNLEKLADSIGQDSPDANSQILGYVTDALKQSVKNGNVVKETDISMGEYPGKEVQIEEGDNISITRAYLVNNTLYEQSAMNKKTDSIDDINKFLDSFKLNK